MRIHVEIQDFRAIRYARAEFDGVCVVAGENGAGKSSLLRGLAFMARSYRQDFHSAFQADGGASDFLPRRARSTSPATRLAIGDGTAEWSLEPAVSSGALQFPIRELLNVQDAQLIDAGEFGHRFDGTRVVRNDARTVLARAEEALLLGASHNVHLGSVLAFADSFERYHDYQLLQLRTLGSAASSDMTLSATALNAFSVLRNWLLKLETRKRVDEIRDALSEAFPGQFGEFDFDIAAQTVALKFVAADRHSISLFNVSNGVLVGLLHLMAAHSVREGGTIAIDEFENGLHPHAIRVLIDEMRAIASKRNANILLTTHSPTVLDCFNGDLDRVWVMSAT